MSFAFEPGMNPVCFEDLVQKGHGVMRRLVFPAKDRRNPVLSPERPWEGAGVLFPSVWRCPDTGLWRMWYATAEKVICYAESDDGAAWRRPELGRVAFNGSRANNIVLEAPHPTPCVYQDLSADPSQRYRLAVSDTGEYQDEGGVKLYVSADGIDWRLLKDPIIKVRNDSQCSLLRHPRTGVWLAYHRPGFVVRSITRSRSQDGLRFQGHGQRIAPDDRDRPRHIENYALAAFAYGHLLVGMMKVFANVWDDMRCWIELVVSRDGDTWQRLSDRRPFIPLGEDGAWDSLCMSPGHALVPEGDGHWFYYDCWNARHTHELGEPYARAHVGRAFITRNRFAECAAMSETAWVATVPCLPQADELTLDYDATGGEVRASVEYEDGTAASGFSRKDGNALTGSSHEGRIRFAGGTLRQFGRTPVRLMVHLRRGARLYGLGVA
jgi:hypothetical protein